jgi:acyl-CoA hydrolase
MRRAFELGYATAYTFCGNPPIFKEVDEVLFRAPVEVGDLYVTEF